MHACPDSEDGNHCNCWGDSFCCNCGSPADLRLDNGATVRIGPPSQDPLRGTEPPPDDEPTPGDTDGR